MPFDLVVIGFFIILASLTGWVAAAPTQFISFDEISKSVSSPLLPEYEINPNGSVTLRICFNWSCAYRETITFTLDDMKLVKKNMSSCTGTTLNDRLQRLRIGIWQMESLAEKYQPLLANDLAINDFEQEIEGRTDCIDNASNTTTYLQILRDIGELPGWKVSPTTVRNRFDITAVHWTAVITDMETGLPWSVDSWFRPNGHLPMVMPLQSWVDEKKGWEPPFEQINITPRTVNELCSNKLEHLE